jgi:histidine ammonia-lyase
MATAIVLRPGELSLGQLREVARGGALVTLDPKARTAIDDSRRIVESFVAEQRTAYGINTGFGRLANTRIEADRLAQLQTNIVLSHSTGTGPLLDDTTVRLVMALKIASLARGFSGISWPVVEALTKLLEQRVYPCIPAKGSVGASGDLAPLAHLAAVLLGVGSVRHDGQIRPAEEGLAIAGLAPMVLGPKEGLALLNGTQVSTALALEGLFAAEDVFAAAVVAGSLSVDAAKGSDVPFDPRIHAVRGHPGQSDIARIYRTRGARPSRPKRHRPGVPDAARGQHHPSVPSGLHTGPGPLFPALSAPGDGRLLGPAALCMPGAPAGGQRGHRQSLGLPGRGRGAVRR